MRDLHDNIDVRRAISPQYSAGDTPIVSQIIDRQGFDSVEFLIHIGAVADANVTFAVLLEESDDSGMSGAEGVADADLLGTETVAGFRYDDDNEVRKLGYIGSMRYLRMTITPTGNSSPGSYISAAAVLGHPSQAPV